MPIADSLHNVPSRRAFFIIAFCRVAFHCFNFRLVHDNFNGAPIFYAGIFLGTFVRGRIEMDEKEPADRPTESISDRIFCLRILYRAPRPA